VDGFVIWCKRLEKGSFPKKIAKEHMTRKEFILLLEGVIPRKITPRFSLK
jgi:transposase